jgi:hypothetical protein
MCLLLLKIKQTCSISFFRCLCTFWFIQMFYPSGCQCYFNSLTCKTVVDFPRTGTPYFSQSTIQILVDISVINITYKHKSFQYKN